MVPFGLNGITVPMREKHGSGNGSRASHRGFSAVAGEAQGGAEALSAAPSAGGTGPGGALLPAPWPPVRRRAATPAATAGLGRGLVLWQTASSVPHKPPRHTAEGNCGWLRGLLRSWQKSSSG